MNTETQTSNGAETPSAIVQASQEALAKQDTGTPRPLPDGMKDHTMREWSDKFPGAMAVADVRGTYSSCIVKLFSGDSANHLDKQINDFFQENRGLMVVDMQFWGDGTSIHAAMTYTATLSSEYLDLLHVAQAKTEEFMAELKAQQLEDAQANASEEERMKLETQRLAEIGKKCETNHGALIKQGREMRKDKHKKGHR